MPAGFLLAIVLFTSLPRALFHHCDERLFDQVDHALSVVHTDSHCPICEAPVPICVSSIPLDLAVYIAVFGECLPASILSVLVPEADALHLRGPPLRA